MTAQLAALPNSDDPASPVAEAIRLRLADAWGEMGASWGVAPAIARVHAYLMTRQAALTEREVREALGLSHRAASLALADAEAWGLVERVSEPRRVGRRGPAAAASPGDRELVALREWLSTFLVFVRLFDRAVGLVPRLEPRELERALRLLGEVPDNTILRLVKLLDALPDEDVLSLVEAVGKLSPTAARRATKLMSGVVRTVGR